MSGVGDFNIGMPVRTPSKQYVPLRTIASNPNEVLTTMESGSESGTRVQTPKISSRVASPSTQVSTGT